MNGNRLQCLSEGELALLVPFDVGCTLPGEGTSFHVLRGWDVDPTRAIVPPAGGYIVSPRGLLPEQHLEAACQAACGPHPLGQPPCIGEGIAFAIAAQLALGPQIADLRRGRIALAEAWVKELQPKQQAMADNGDPVLHRFASRPTLTLMRILRIIKSPACGYLERMHLGLDDVGQGQRSGTFPPTAKSEPAWSIKQLLEHARNQNPELVDRVRRHHPYARKLWEQSVQAEKSGALGPARSAAEWMQECATQPNIVFCRKFPVVQTSWEDDLLDANGGSNAQGLPCPKPTSEVRPCNDTSAAAAGCSYNLAWASQEKIICSDAEVVLAQMLAAQLAFEEVLEGTKEDLKKAYNQVPRSRRLVRMVQLFWHAERAEVVGREQYAHDFGAAGAVSACSVVFRALRDIANRWLYVNCDHYADDYWLWEPAFSVESARQAVRKLFALLGFELKESKSVEGRRLPLIGLVFESCLPAPEASNRARRREPLARELERPSISPPEAGAASSAIGKVVFASRGVHGKAGVHARRPLYAALKHIEKATAAGEWPHAAKIAFVLWAHLLRRGPPRSLPLKPDAGPAACLYGDASMRLRRVAAMLIIPGGEHTFRAGFSVVLPQTVVDGLGPCADYAINGLELWWIVKSLEIWGRLLRGKCLLCFGDNGAAIAACVSGYSRSPFVAQLAGVTHMLLCEYDIAAWFEWVHTDSNPLDPASRQGGEEAIRSLGAAVVQVEPSIQADLRPFHPRDADVVLE